MGYFFYLYLILIGALLMSMLAIHRRQMNWLTERFGFNTEFGPIPIALLVAVAGRVTPNESLKVSAVILAVILLSISVRNSIRVLRSSPESGAARGMSE